MGTTVGHDVIALERIVRILGEKWIFGMILARGVDRMDLHGDLLGPTTVGHHLPDEKMLDRTDLPLQTFAAHLVLAPPVTTTTTTLGIVKETQVLDVIEDTEGRFRPS